MSHRAALIAAVESALSGRRLLSHPYYERWSRGELSIEDLREYAGQYRHVEAALPSWLVTIRDSTTNEVVRGSVQRNLDDEAGGTVTHVQLFDGFVRALGAPSRPPTGSTVDLLESNGRLSASSTSAGLAALLAYEVQSPEISASKAAGLRAHYGLGDAAVAFWDTHADVDGDHAAWTVDALEEAGASPEEVRVAARQAADAWWGFLDEREAVSRTALRTAESAAATH